jgi:RNA polymerase sigma-70 factor (sigma-E family)
VRQSGVVLSFAQFATHNLASWLRLAGALTSDAGLAEDLVQDVLVKLHTRWAQIGAVAAPEAYVHRMITNEYLSWRRSRHTRLVPVTAEHLEDLTGGGADPTIAHADRDALRAEITRLPRQQQAVLALRYYGGLSDTEIATTLDCAPGTVRGYASRALATLRVTSTHHLLPTEGP